MRHVQLLPARRAKLLPVHHANRAVSAILATSVCLEAVRLASEPGNEHILCSVYLVAGVHRARLGVVRKVASRVCVCSDVIRCG